MGSFRANPTAPALPILRLIARLPPENARMAAETPRRVTIPLTGIEPDSSLPGRWRNWVALAVLLVTLAILLIIGPRPLGSVASIILTRPVDPFIGWLVAVFGTLLCLALAFDRWLAHRSSRVEIDRAGRSLRILRSGLWSRRAEAAPLIGARDLALVETRADGAPLWRLELRWTRAAGREPLLVAATHDIGRLEPIARRVAQEAGLELLRLRPGSR